MGPVSSSEIGLMYMYCNTRLVCPSAFDGSSPGYLSPRQGCHKGQSISFKEETISLGHPEAASFDSQNVFFERYWPQGYGGVARII